MLNYQGSFVMTRDQIRAALQQCFALRPETERQLDEARSAGDDMMIDACADAIQTIQNGIKQYMDCLRFLDQTGSTEFVFKLSETVAVGM